MKLSNVAKIAILTLIIALIFPIVGIIAHAQTSQSSTPKRPWIECRKNYRQALKDESKVYLDAIKKANTDYKQALKETKNISDKDTRKNFLQKAKTEMKDAKRLALTAIKTNKKKLKADVKTCEAEKK